MEKWENPLLTLGERCVAFAENEMKNGVKEDSPNSFTSPRIKEYFGICTRLVNGKETPVNFTKGNWCAASASFCLKNSLLPGEIAPHGYRLGVVEIVSDLQKTGYWRSVTKALQQSYMLKVGDLIIFDRSQPGKPETSWWRHIGRIYEVSSLQTYYGDTEFKCISGNSYGEWRISNHKITQKNLLGFGEYPDINSGPPQLMSAVDWDNLPVEDLAPLHDSGSDLAADDFYSIYKERIKK